jgi:pimeloyl-ACP methyl ester carboxylesterase
MSTPQQPTKAVRVTSLANFAGLALTAFSLLCGGTQALAKENAQTGVAEVNGTKLYYEMVGKGPAVVLVHGGLVDSRLWNDQMKEFAKHHRVVRYDLRGFGRSAAAPQPFSHIEDLGALMDFLKIERATVVGLSVGGIIAADFALEHPERVDRLVLVGAGLRGDKQPPDKDALKAYEAATKGMAEEFVNVTMKSGLYATVREGSPAYARLRQMMLENFKAVSTFAPGFLKYPAQPTIERLGQIKAPTLVIIGSDDAQSLQNVADTLAAGIPGTRKVVIPGASHHPPVEKPDEFNKAVLSFLKEK